jgi:hypothetical protein
MNRSTSMFELDQAARTIAKGNRDDIALEIFVYDEDSTRSPHFHFQKRTSEVIFETRILLEHAEYVSTSDPRLSEADKRFIVQNLSEIANPSGSFTKWDKSCLYWNCGSMNESSQIPENLNMPNYSSLETLEY